MDKAKRELIDRQFERARDIVKDGSSKLDDKLTSDSGYQRRTRLGTDGRMREAMDRQVEIIKERHYQGGDSCPSESQIRQKVAERAERLSQKRG